MRGRLVYVIGASGSGKDTLIKAAADALADHPDIRFARRVITRQADPEGENHQPMSRDAFNARAEQDLFAMHWFANGHGYGVGLEINDWLSAGHIVVVNGSRQWLGPARDRYQELLPLLIEVSHATLRQRLLNRGRESVDEIEARMQRHQQMQPPSGQCIVINNDGPLTEAVQTFINAIIEPTGGAAPCK